MKNSGGPPACKLSDFTDILCWFSAARWARAAAAFGLAPGAAAPPVPAAAPALALLRALAAALKLTVYYLTVNRCFSTRKAYGSSCENRQGGPYPKKSGMREIDTIEVIAGCSSFTTALN